MYTNALMGTAMDEWHVWRPAAKEGLDAALEADEYAALACECGEQEAIHEPDSEGQQHLRLVPVRDLGVETLADFLVHPGTYEPCARCACSTLGLEWPPEQAGVEVEDIEDPEYVAKELHEQQAGEMYDERYGDVPEDRVAAKHLEQTSLALGEQHRLKRLDTGEVVEATVVESDAPEVLDDGETLYHVVAYASEGEALEQALGAAFDRVRINQQSQPMHLFLRGQTETALCGITAEAANLQNTDTDEVPQDPVFPAENNFDTLEGLLEQWQEGPPYYCEDCGEALRQQTATLRGFSEDAQRRFAAGHGRAQGEDCEDTYALTDEDRQEFEERFGQGPAAPGAVHPNCRSGHQPIRDATIEVANDLEQQAKQQVPQVGSQEVEFSVTVEAEDAEELRRFLQDRAAEDSR